MGSSRFAAAAPLQESTSEGLVAAQLSFSNHPPDVLSGAVVPRVTVTVEDQNGQLVRGATNVITLNVVSSSGTLGGTISAKALAGTVTFSNVTFTGDVGTYRLEATTPGLTTATTRTFSVVTPSAIESLHAEEAQDADAFVDSVGVNIHLGAPAYSGNWPLTLGAIQDLGVRHYRDGMTNTGSPLLYARYQEMGLLGIKGLFITPTVVTRGTIDAFLPKVSATFEGMETINEADRLSTDWVAAVKANMEVLYPTVTRFGGFVVGPSFTVRGSTEKVGDVSNLETYGNLHNYFGGRNPGTGGWGGRDASGHVYGSIAYDLDDVAVDSPGRPVFTTETGYSTDETTTNYVDEAVEAKYVPRLLMEQWNSGIRRTYLYQLIQTDVFGLVSASGDRKPVFNSVSHLLAALSDPGRGFRGAKLNFALMGGSDDLHHALFQKRDGSFWLALWIEAKGYDPDNHFEISVPSQAVTLVTQDAFNATGYQIEVDGSLSTNALGKSTSHPLTVTDRIMLVQLQ